MNSVSACGRLANRHRKQGFELRNPGRVLERGMPPEAAGISRPIDRAVFESVCRFWNWKIRAAWPSYATIARDCGWSRRTVFNAVVRLEAEGLLVVEHLGRVRRSNTYKIPSLERAADQLDRLKRGRAPVTAGGRPRSPSKPKTAFSVPSTSAPRAHRRGKHEGRVCKDPTLKCDVDLARPSLRSPESSLRPPSTCGIPEPEQRDPDRNSLIPAPWPRWVRQRASAIEMALDLAGGWDRFQASGFEDPHVLVAQLTPDWDLVRPLRDNRAPPAKVRRRAMAVVLNVFKLAESSSPMTQIGVDVWSLHQRSSASGIGDGDPAGIGGGP